MSESHPTLMSYWENKVIRTAVFILLGLLIAAVIVAILRSRDSEASG